MKWEYNINHSLSISNLFDIRSTECIQVTNTELKINVDKTILSLIYFQNILVNYMILISVTTVFTEKQFLNFHVLCIIEFKYITPRCNITSSRIDKY